VLAVSPLIQTDPKTTKTGWLPALQPGMALPDREALRLPGNGMLTGLCD
jgi:hypothetical protein